MVDDAARGNEKQGRISDYSKMFTQVTNVWRMNETVRAFVFAKRFARLAAELLGVKGVRLYHDQALIKEPGGKPTPWHQDHYYWPLETDDTVTMWKPLIDCPHEMGTMDFVAGSHINPAFAEMPISESSQEYFSRIISQQNLAPTHFSLNAGDATFHYGKTLHSAPSNSTTIRREVITIIYYADRTRLMQPENFNEHRKVDMEVFHPGQQPGEIAASALNPLLWFLSER
jgi:ectoine hydroxylase-related dioxygenase (phytanoyl-CoA dioxygenase family)